MTRNRVNADIWGSASLVPTGTLAKFPPGVTPVGWISCDATTAAGAASINVSRTTYADLFAVIGTTYGPGDGSTTFGIPAMVETEGVWTAASPLPSSNNLHT